MTWRGVLIGCVGALVAAQPAVAQRAGALVVAYASPTLTRIDSTRVVFSAVRVPGREAEAIGYSLDLCDVVVDEIAREVGGAPSVEYRPVTPENRFELVQAGEIDLECGSSTNTAERRKVVAFSPTLFVTGTKLLVRRGSGIRTFRDLEGKTVVLTRGTVQETAVPRIAGRQKLAV